jgi:hypothetical protein
MVDWRTMRPSHDLIFLILALCGSAMLTLWMVEVAVPIS